MTSHDIVSVHAFQYARQWTLKVPYGIGVLEVTELQTIFEYGGVCIDKRTRNVQNKHFSAIGSIQTARILTQVIMNDEDYSDIGPTGFLPITSERYAVHNQAKIGIEHIELKPVGGFIPSV